MNMLPNNENISELIVRLRSWVDNPHLRSLGYGRYGTKASSDIEQTINEIEHMRGATKNDPKPILTDKERKALEGMLNTIMYEPNKIAIESILSRFG